MDKPMTIKAGILVTSLCGLVVSLIAVFAGEAKAKQMDHEKRLITLETTAAILLEDRAEQKRWRERIEEKVDRMLEERRK